MLDTTRKVKSSRNKGQVIEALKQAEGVVYDTLASGTYLGKPISPRGKKYLSWFLNRARLERDALQKKNCARDISLTQFLHNKKLKYLFEYHGLRNVGDLLRDGPGAIQKVLSEQNPPKLLPFIVYVLYYGESNQVT